MSETFQKKSFSRRRKSCPFTGANAPAIDWKDVNMLNRFLSERGKIIPSRITAVSAPKQRVLAKAIKQARFMALIAPVKLESDRPERPFRSREGGEGRDNRGPRPDRQDRNAAPAAE